MALGHGKARLGMRSLMALVGMVPEDDDGNDASKPSTAATAPAQSAEKEATSAQVAALRDMAKAKGDGWKSFLKEATGKKGKALFHPLRLALTGRDQGPELAVLLPLIGRVKAVGRLG